MTSRRSLVDLIPPVYRAWLAAGADPGAAADPRFMAALLEVLDASVESVRAELLGGLDDRFVETCADAELPHFAALLGLRELPGVRPRRALIANAMSYRRRKGTLAALEDVARAATGWTAKATEYFPLLVTTSHPEHPRPDRPAVLSVADPVVAARVGTLWDGTAHTADVRQAAGPTGGPNGRVGGGRHNLHDVAVDLWRLRPVPELRRPSYPLADGDWRYRVSPLGADLPLYTPGAPEPDVTHRLTREGAVEPLTVLDAYAMAGRWYGEGPAAAIAVYVGGTLVDPSEAVLADLSEGTTGWGSAVPATATVLIDPARGRLRFAAKPNGPVTVSTFRALPDAIGGGGYERAVRPVPPQAHPVRVALTATGVADPAGTTPVATLADALTACATRSAAVVGAGNPRPLAWIVDILDSARYASPAPVALPADTTVVLRSRPGQWPVLTDGLDVAAGHDARLVLDGLLVAGPVRLTGEPAALEIHHSTLVPGHRLTPAGAPERSDAVSLLVAPDAGARVRVVARHSICGPVVGPGTDVELDAAETILAAAGPATPAVRDVPALVGAPVPGLTAASFGSVATPTLLVRRGAGEPVAVRLSEAPADLPTAADRLGRALRQLLGVGGPAAGADNLTVRVVVHEQRLVVLGPPDAALTFEPAPAPRPGDAAALDPAATVLGLTAAAGARARIARLGAPLVAAGAAGGPMTSGALPVGQPLRLTVHGWSDLAAPATHGTLVVDPCPASLTDVAAALQTALRAGPAGDAGVCVADGRLVLVPGCGPTPAGTPVLRLAVTDDPAQVGMADRLGLRRARPVLAGPGGAPDDPGGGLAYLLGDADPGSALVSSLAYGPGLHGDRVTLLGEALTESVEVSNALVTGALRVRRRQQGCVRYSWIGAGSQTPRRFASHTRADSLPPAFVATRYGLPGFAQLASWCPPGIATGADDGAELGAFHDVGQPERLAAAQSLLGEYVRFTVEPGVFLQS